MGLTGGPHGSPRCVAPAARRRATGPRATQRPGPAAAPSALLLALALLLHAAVGARAAPAARAAAPPACRPAGGAGGAWAVASDCAWDAAAGDTLSGSGGALSLEGSQPTDGNTRPATVTITAAPSGAAPGSAVQAGARLRLTRLLLNGFAVAGPGGGIEAPPLLWPTELATPGGTGSAPATLEATDVRFVLDSPAAFGTMLAIFKGAPNAAVWTDDASFIHIDSFTDGRTTLRSVGILLRSPPDAPNPLKLPPPVVAGCLPAATNATLVPSLLRAAAVETPRPLLVYVATNVSLGEHPRLPATGVAIRRPVVFVGLASQRTAVDFQMVVNQLNETGSNYSNVTFVGLVLENLAPGDAVTSQAFSSGPFSITITNNVWAAFYNRSAANDVRLALYNVTLVLPQESEMSYATYMFTMFSSTLPYLKQQTSFYTDVLKMKALRFSPGPGSSAITVHTLRSDYHWWHDVILTTEPLVAPALPLPPRPLVLATPTRASPLVQAVYTAEDLRSFAQEAIIGDRAHILLILANVSLADLDAAGPIRLNSSLSLIGSSPDPARRAAPLAAGPAPPGGRTQDVSLSFGFARGAVVLPSPAPSDALQLRQLALTQLPQGPGAAAAAGGAGPSRLIPKEMLTILLWSFDRPFTGSPLNLDGVTLLLPKPEADYFAAEAVHNADFVVELTGAAGENQALTFSGAQPLAQGGAHVAAFQGPGLVATNLTLLPDPEDPGPGYVWREPSHQEHPPQRRRRPAWVAPVAGSIAGVGGAAAAAGAAFALWRHRRQRQQRRQGSGAWLKGASREASTDTLDACRACSEKSGGPGGGACTHHGSAQGSAGSYCNSSSRGTHGERYSGGGHARAKSGSGPGVVGGSAAGGSGPSGGNTPSLSWQLEDAGASGGEPLVMAGSTVDTASYLVLPAPGAAAGGGGGGAKSGQGVRFVPVLRTTTPSPEAGAAPRDAGRRAAGAGAEGAAAAAAGGRAPSGAGPRPLAPSGAGGDVSRPRDAQQHSQDGVHATVAAGMQRWRAAVSSTTMLLMERRMEAAAGAAPPGVGSGNTDVSLPASPPPRTNSAGSDALDGAAAGGGGGGGAASSLTRSASQPSASTQLQLGQLLGSGSFGAVYLATWRGKKVAVKIMQLPANALLEQQALGAGEEEEEREGADGGAGRRRERQAAQSSPPHMAVMEAVLSSTMSHPNVVQVYTYWINPLTSGSLVSGETGHQLAPPGPGPRSSTPDIAGWCLKLVMEYCNEGSLRDALDRSRLCPRGAFLAPATVLALAHDVASAMLHLHTEGIVHGDLKASNVLLTGSSELTGPSGWGYAGGRRLTAKVADFGLATPLGATDTHATLIARGTPTHMSPELFLSGHVSKASDVYAFGILLYECISSQRAYLGVPIPLLPHEVARQGLRPTWPPGLPPGSRDLQQLAEACWAQQPQDRPSFDEIMHALDLWTVGCRGWPPAPPTAAAAATQPLQQPAQQQPEQQQPEQQQQQQQPQEEGPGQEGLQQPQERRGISAP